MTSMKQKLDWRLWFFFNLWVVASLCGCDASHVTDSASSAEETTAVSVASLEGFSSTIYAFGQQNGCVTCHASRVNPQWQNPNVELAYQFARPFVDFANPVASIFASYVSNNHCNNPICNNPNNESVMQSLLTQWALIEVQQGSSTSGAVAGSTLANPPYVTATLPIPNPLPLITTKDIAVLRFNLSELTPALSNLSGAVLELSIQSFNTGQNEYKIFNPRIYGNLRSINLSGIHIYVRPASGSGLGTEDVIQGDRWADVQATVRSAATPSPLPDGPVTSLPSITSIVLGVEAQSEADVITIGFAQIR